MKTPQDHISQIHLLFFISLPCTATAFAQRERILWSKLDADATHNRVNDAVFTLDDQD